VDPSLNNQCNISIFLEPGVQVVTYTLLEITCSKVPGVLPTYPYSGPAC
jgi:hypothetical protein